MGSLLAEVIPVGRHIPPFTFLHEVIINVDPSQVFRGRWREAETDTATVTLEYVESVLDPDWPASQAFGQLPSTDTALGARASQGSPGGNSSPSCSFGDSREIVLAMT